jgi:DNA-binding response OmpR family regulator
MKILIIEDEQHLSESISVYLKKEGFVCESSSDFDNAEEKIHLYDYDCILVDIALPGGNGLDLIRQLKKKETNTGIIVISAKGSLDDKITGLEIGADDYIAKPFHLSELNARIKSVIRRRNFDGKKEICFHEIKIIPDKNAVLVNDQELILTKREYDLILFFLSNIDRVITKESIAEHLWGDHIDMADSFDFVYTHIKNVRKKILEKGGGDYIRTIYGMGYKFSHRI